MVLTLAVLQDAPGVETPAPPSPQDVIAARELVQDLRAAASSRGPQGATLVTTVDQLASAARLGGRLVSGVRSRVSRVDQRILGELAIPVPWPVGQRWLNVEVLVPEFSGGVALDRVVVGGWRVPPSLALGAVRFGGNVVVGNKFGDTVLSAASALRITERDLMFDITMDDMGRNGVLRGVFGGLRGDAMPTGETVEFYHLLIRDAMGDGRLPAEGSFLPYVEFALQAAFAHSTDEDFANAYTAAVFGLAKACGSTHFSTIVGQLAFDVGDQNASFATTCAAITMNGRIDTRRHFITAAALQAASNRGVSVPIGEYKELYDSVASGGFDFTDLAANQSGIRFSNTVMEAPRARWPGLMARITTEQDIIVSFDAIPTIMSEADFVAQFTDIDSPQFANARDRIEERISALPFHAP